jgi:hypothetical protein
MFAVSATNLNVEPVCNTLENVLLESEVRQMDVHGRAESRAKVGRARGNVAELRRVSKLSDRLNVRAGLAEASEDSSDVSSILHRDNAKLVFFVAPDKEGLLLVVENSSALGPAAV